MSKPSLSEVQRKQIAASAGIAEELPPPAQRRPGRVLRTHLTVFFKQPVKRQLRQMGLDQNKTLQALMTEAINDLFAKYKQPEIAE